MKEILITDSLFMFDEHVKQFEAAGHKVERLDKPMASEAELIKAVKGKAAYILGGVERVSEKVLEAADELEVITFTGADWQGYIPGHKIATKRGIAITNTPGANAYAVAEYSITLILVMIRRVLELGVTGDKSFMTTQSLKDMNIGVVGMGNIGERTARMLIGLGASNVSYWNRTPKPELEQELGIAYKSLEQLFRESSLITNHLSSAAGDGFIDRSLLASLPDQAIIVSTAYESVIDADALFDELKAGRLRAAFDVKPEERFRELPLSVWFSSNESTAFNTSEANKAASDMTTRSVLNILAGESDDLIVNPEYKENKR